MPQSIRDVHSSGLKLVSESELTPPSNKYKRISIPNNPNRHCLGYLEGPAASLTEDTRNGRGYTIALWNNVENSEEFKEGMKYAIIVGELDHPEERVDYSLTKGCVILTDFEIREDEGIVWARFAILDNEQGRILLSYAQFGSVLGVSSRGLGDEIVENGRTIIDPNTYEFFCFDVVAFPAVTCARQSYSAADEVVESVYTAFSDKVIAEANKSTSIEDLTQLKNVVESTSVSNKKELVETISHKLSSLSESADDQSIARDEKPVLNDEEDDKKEILLGELELAKKSIASRDAKIEELKNMLSKRHENAKFFRKAIQDQRVELESLTQSVDDSLNSTSEISSEYEDLKQKSFVRESELIESLNKSNSSIARYKESNSKLKSLVNSYRQQFENANTQLRCATNKISVLESKLSKLESAKASLQHSVDRLDAERQLALTESRSASSNYSKQIKALESRLSASNEKIRDLESACADKDKAFAESTKQLNITQEKLEKASTKSAELLDSYLKRCCEAYGLSYDSVKMSLPKVFSKDQIDATVQRLSERQQRFNDLPIAVQPISGRIVEHNNPLNTDAEGTNSFVAEALRRGM